MRLTKVYVYANTRKLLEQNKVFAIPRLMLTNISITPLYSSISLVLLVLICIV